MNRESNDDIDADAIVKELENHLKKHFWWFFHTTPNNLQLRKT
jgi:hypothetical protein